MHIPDTVLSPPVAAATTLAALAGFRVALKRAAGSAGDRTTVLMGVVAAFLFAAQMVNFPVGPGVSGHLLGGVLAAVVLGPWAGAVVMGAVLVVQCLLFADGGITALGANFVNMGLIGAVGGYALYAPLRRWLGGRAGVLLAAMAAAWLSVLFSAGAFALELACSGRFTQFPRILAWMVLVHAAIGVGEAVITGLVLRLVLLARADLLYEPAESRARISHAGQLAAVGLGVAVALAVILGPLAWEAPDGLEFVGRKLGFLRASGVAPLAPFADYRMTAVKTNVALATALAGLIGTVTVFVLGLAMARVFTGKVAPDEA